MPDVKKGETRSEYVSRCVPVCMKEGLTKKQALGKCEGMYDQKNGKAKKAEPAQWDDNVK